MLSPRDAQLAEPYAVGCEDQARAASLVATDLDAPPCNVSSNQPLRRYEQFSPKEVPFFED
jgi:hypothetical protein